MWKRSMTLYWLSWAGEFSKSFPHWCRGFLVANTATMFPSWNVFSLESFSWLEGIIAGREVLKEGMGCLIGSGEDICVRVDLWLSTEGPLRPIGPPTQENQHLRVSDLVDQDTRQWNWTAIRKHLPGFEQKIRVLSLVKTVEETLWFGFRIKPEFTPRDQAMVRLRGPRNITLILTSTGKGIHGEWKFHQRLKISSGKLYQVPFQWEISLPKGKWW